MAAALELFESGAIIADSSGTTSRGSDAATCLVERYYDFEAGAPQVTGNEVLWTEALPIRTPDNLQFQQDARPEPSTDVPYYAFVQAMCALLTNGKIHTAGPDERPTTLPPGVRDLK
jgi:hypothetical protein